VAYLEKFCEDPQAYVGICEPTGGFYGASLYQFLIEREYPLKLVENATTKHVREKIFGKLPKTDQIDARVMARIGYLHEAVGEEFTLRLLKQLSPGNSDLLALCRDSWKLSRMVTRARNQFAQLMAVIFPELKTFFVDSVSSITAVKLVAAYPTPALLAEASQKDIVATLWEAKAYKHAKAATKLQELARSSSGLLPDPGRVWRLTWLTDFLLNNYQAQKALEKQIEALLVKRPDYALVSNVPFAGPITLGTILAASGEISRFSNYRRYVAYTGYFAGLEKSQTIDRTRMSKRGNRDLKRAFFQIAAPLVWFDQGDNPYKRLFRRKISAGRPWYKAMPYVCAALARHIYHCLKYKEPYSEEKAFKGSSAMPDQALLILSTTLDEKFEEMDTYLPHNNA